MLMTRAEEMLWPATERRVPWRDVASRALTNPRWPWLPPKGLEQLRKIAEGQGRWRYSEDGYIEKGPFPPAEDLAFRSRNAITKRIRARRRSRFSRKMPVRMAASTIRPDPSVSTASPVIPDTIFETDETVLWFLAVDPDGEHETGDASRWSNKLTLTHQPKMLPAASGSSN